MGKRISFIFVLFLILFSFSGATARGFEIVGGYYFLGIDPELNQYIQKYNEYIDERISTDEAHGITFTTKSIDPLEKVKRASGYYLGFSTRINNLVLNRGKELFLVSKYESFSTKKEGSLYTEWTDLGGDTGTTTARIKTEIKVDGLYGGILYKVNNYMVITGGIGYYQGKLNDNGFIEMSGAFREELNYDTDLKGTIGYKLGVRLNYKLLDSLSILGSMNYRTLVMELEDGIKIDSPFEVQISKVNLNGLEGQLGIMYEF